MMPNYGKRPPMTHQLVFQFACEAIADYDDLIALEQHIEASLPPNAMLDGHDSGCGEFNIFVHTDDPEASFQLIREAIQHGQPALSFSAGFRSFEQDQYVPLWPPDSQNFSVA